MLVVGCTHLGRGETPEPEGAVTAMVDRLAAWEPDAVAIETLTGEQVGTMRQLSGPFEGLRVGGFPDAVACAEASGFRGTLWEARAAGRDPSAGRAHRIEAWAAAYEPHTALLLAGGRPEDVAGLPAALAERLVALREKGTEAWRVAGEVAQRHGLQRLHPFDDHMHWAAWADDGGAHDAMMAAAAEVAGRSAWLQHAERISAEAATATDLWDQWRELNSPAAVHASDDLESGVWLEAAGHEREARRQLAGWRARNLSMAGHLRQVAGEYPGGRVLALVGAAHKGPLEAALAQGQWDVEVAEAGELEA